MTLPAVTWLPSPFKNARDSRYPIRGVVNHRIVGTLPSARTVFNGSTTRKASSHFGIGYVGGRLTLDQYVDLSDMAWTNGDVREPTWAFYQPGVNPNLTTVTIEHEDGGSANRGRVSEEVWQTSMELQRLLVSGDAESIRRAGIRVRDTRHVTQLAAVPRDERGFIDHHQIAGPNKPYCFRRWLDDPGFVEGSPSRRDRLLSYLEADVADIDTFILETIRIDGGANIRSAPDDSASVLFQTASPSSAVSVGTKNGFHAYWIDAQKRWAYTSTSANVISREPYTSGGFTQADIDAARTAGSASGTKAGRVAMKTEAVAAVQALKP